MFHLADKKKGRVSCTANEENEPNQHAHVVSSSSCGGDSFVMMVGFVVCKKMKRITEQ